MSGVQTVSTPDNSGTGVGYIDQGDWMDYRIGADTIPKAGKYKIRYRISTFFDSTPTFSLLDASGNVLDTVMVFQTRGWDNYVTLTHTDVALPAGPQTFRIQSTSPENWNINWFEIENIPSSIGTTLPVHFVLFNGRCVNGAQSLSWKTAQESNVQFYAVERSSNGREWSTLARLPAAKQTGTEQSYSYTDNAATSTAMY